MTASSPIIVPANTTQLAPTVGAEEHALRRPVGSARERVGSIMLMGRRYSARGPVRITRTE